MSVIPPSANPCVHRIWQGVSDAPPPPLAGALAAWLSAEGEAFRVVDPRGGIVDWSGDGPLWVHLEGDNWKALQPHLAGTATSLTFFGPEARRAEATYPSARIVLGDPEGEGATPDLLPITTYAGFGPQPGGLFRILAGRYGLPRPLSTLLREVVYLVETFGAGHLLFDDEDLARYGDLMERFEAELSHLPWTLTWEGSAGGLRAGATRDFPSARL